MASGNFRLPLLCIRLPPLGRRGTGLTSRYVIAASDLNWCFTSQLILS